jgi:hypothetical protein
MLLHVTLAVVGILLALLAYSCFRMAGHDSRAEEQRGPLPPHYPLSGSRRLSARAAVGVARRLRNHAVLRSLWGTQGQRRR